MKHQFPKHVVSLFAVVCLMMGLGGADISAQDLPKISGTGFLSQHYSKVIMRSGNSTKHHALATFHRKGIPFQVLYVHNPESADPRTVWVRVRDYEGDTGWIRRDQLSSKQTAMIIADQGVKLYPTLEGARTQKYPLALLPKHHVLNIAGCDQVWCQVMLVHQGHGKLEGYVLREALWGTK